MDRGDNPHSVRKRIAGFIVLLAPLWMAIGLLTVGIGGGQAIRYTEEPAFCNTCHTMNPQYESWKVSGHGGDKDISCMECHADPGVFGEFKAHLSGVRYIYIQLTGKFTPPIKAEVSSKVCSRCHDRESLAELDNDTSKKRVTVEHGKHLAKSVACTDCHAKLVHGATDFKRQPEKKWENFHNACLDCHVREKVALKADGSVVCVACHKDLAKVTPEDHKTDWREGHGKASRTQSCGECHLGESAGKKGKFTQSPALVSAAGQDTCAACHQIPMPHPTGWLGQHKAEFYKDTALCAGCHGPLTEGSGMKSSGNPADLPNSAECKQCHKVDLPHGDAYLSRHGRDALSQGTETCAQCHSSRNPVDPKASYASDTFCSSCHGGVTMPHPAGFLGGHGAAAVASGNPQCLTCHSSANPVSPGASHAANNFCSACHAGTEMPHNPSFISGHGQHARESSQVCQACHSPANPVNPRSPQAAPGFCSNCHASYRHGPAWVAGHGSQVNQTCATCHGEQHGAKTTCSACHLGKPGDRSVPWHPDYWFMKHANVVLTQGEQVCLKCHAQVKPLCSQCHKSR